VKRSAGPRDIPPPGPAIRRRSIAVLAPGANRIADLLPPLRWAKLNLVPEYCTCGAKLPEDALFCHRCGRPQRKDLIPEEEPETEPEAPVVPAPAAARAGRAAEAAALKIDFGDPIAVRVSLFVACLVAFLWWALPIGCLLWFFGGGFLAVYLYGRRTNLLLDSRQGMQLGWVTGMITFTINLIFFVISYVALVQRGWFNEAEKEELSKIPFLADNLEQTLEMMKNPAFQAIGIVVALAFQFVLNVLVTVVGAAVGARVMQKD
jgi:hypothetical protein